MSGYIPINGRDAAQILAGHYFKRDLGGVVSSRFDEYEGREYCYFTADGEERETAVRAACRKHRMRYIPGEGPGEWRNRLTRKLMREHGRDGCYAIYNNPRTWRGPAKQNKPFTERELGQEDKPTATPEQLKLAFG